MKLFDVAVIGGGYAGVLAALRAKRGLGREGAVALVADGPHLVERTRLHEAAAHGRDIRVPLAGLLGPGIERLDGRVEAIRRGQVELADGRRLQATAVIVATGLPTRAGVPGALALEGDGLALHRRIEAARGGPIAVIGGGLTGIELAAELAEAGHRAMLWSPGALGARDLGPGAAAACRTALLALGVELRQGRVTEVADGRVRLDDGSTAPAALAIATVGTSGPAPSASGPRMAASRRRPASRSRSWCCSRRSRRSSGRRSCSTRCSTGPRPRSAGCSSATRRRCGSWSRGHGPT